MVNTITSTVYSDTTARTLTKLWLCKASPEIINNYQDILSLSDRLRPTFLSVDATVVIIGLSVYS